MITIVYRNSPTQLFVEIPPMQVHNNSFFSSVFYSQHMIMMIPNVINNPLSNAMCIYNFYKTKFSYLITINHMLLNIICNVCFFEWNEGILLVGLN